MPGPDILPDPDGDLPARPSQPPAGLPAGADIPELPNRGDPLGNDVQKGPGGLDIGPA